MPLPDHAARVVAERFAALDAQYPGRIDLGTGRTLAGEGGLRTALRRLPRHRQDRFAAAQVGDGTYTNRAPATSD